MGFPGDPNPGLIVDWLRQEVLPRANALIKHRRGRALDQVDVSWTLRGRTAGTARLMSPGRGLLRMNPQLFACSDDNHAELRDTLLHEMAHLCVMSTFRRARPHGHHWRWFAVSLGAVPRATHRLPLKRARRTREYAYRIDERVIWLGPVRHRRLQAGEATYRTGRGRGAPVLRAGDFTGTCRWRGEEDIQT